MKKDQGKEYLLFLFLPYPFLKKILFLIVEYFYLDSFQNCFVLALGSEECFFIMREREKYKNMCVVQGWIR